MTRPQVPLSPLWEVGGCAHRGWGVPPPGRPGGGQFATTHPTVTEGPHVINDLARFHRGLGYAAFAAGMCLAASSVAALFWFAGVIGLPLPARVGVSIAIEVMAATLAASATTARRASGAVDWTAWVGFAFFIVIAAYANVMHVVAYVDVGQSPPWFPRGLFVAAACVFAAACPFGGTWGVHRFGWLRAHTAGARTPVVAMRAWGGPVHVPEPVQARVSEVTDAPPERVTEPASVLGAEVAPTKTSVCEQIYAAAREAGEFATAAQRREVLGTRVLAGRLAERGVQMSEASIRKITARLDEGLGVPRVADGSRRLRTVP